MPTNLLELIEQRAGSSPARHRVVWRKEPLSLAEQVNYPGPVWLDRVDSQSLAPYGLGAEVRRAVHDRRAALRQLGVPEDPSRRLSSLRELERRSVGQELAASSGRAFVPSAPDGMRGTVQIHVAPDRDPLCHCVRRDAVRGDTRDSGSPRPGGQNRQDLARSRRPHGPSSQSRPGSRTVAARG